MDNEQLLAYEQLGRKHWWLTSKYAILRDLLGTYASQLPACPSILDVGCASGVFLESLQHVSDFRTGVDRDPDVLAKFRSPSMQFVAASAESLPFKDASFSVASAIDVIEHLEDDLAALRQIYKVLKPGGLLLISVPAFMCLFGKHDLLFGHKRRYTRKGLSAAMRAAGFEIRKITYIQPAFFIPLWIKRRILPEPKDSLGDFGAPGPLSPVLHWILSLERFIIRKFSIPLGVTLLALGEKKECA